MPATRSATRSGKASLVEPAAPHWITSISASDARRLRLRSGFLRAGKLPEVWRHREQKLLVGGPALALKERAALTPTIATEVFAVELAFMVCEHLLFVFFVSGVTSALPKRKLR